MQAVFNSPDSVMPLRGIKIPHTKQLNNKTPMFSCFAVFSALSVAWQLELYATNKQALLQA